MTYKKRLQEIDKEIARLVEAKRANYEKYRHLAKLSDDYETRIKNLYSLKNHLEHASYVDEVLLKEKP